MEPQNICPHCKQPLQKDPRISYSYKLWAVPSFVFLLSLMFMGLDLVDNGSSHLSFFERLTWSWWAILGTWILYFSVQLLRSRPSFGWIVVPLVGLLFSVFFILLDGLTQPNQGLWGLDWALYVNIPIITFFVLMPLIGRAGRDQPNYKEQLEYLVETLTEQENERET